MHRCFQVNISEDAVDTVLKQIWAKKFFGIECAVKGCENQDIEMDHEFFGIECAVKGCENRDIETHHVDIINCLKDQFGNISVVTKKVDVELKEF